MEEQPAKTALPIQKVKTLALSRAKVALLAKPPKQGVRSVHRARQACLVTLLVRNVRIANGDSIVTYRWKEERAFFALLAFRLI